MEEEEEEIKGCRKAEGKERKEAASVCHNKAKINRWQICMHRGETANQQVTPITMRFQKS